MIALEITGTESPIHRLNPITKIIAVILFWLTALLSFSIPALGAMIVFSISMWVVAKISLRALRPLLALTALVFFIFATVNGFTFYGGKTAMFYVLGFPFWKEGLLFGVALGMKILAVVTVVPLLTQTTPMPKFMAALSKLRLPYKVVFTMGMAFRLVDLVSLTYKDITEAQKLRGHDIKHMNIIKKLTKGYLPLFIPLILTLLRRSGDLDIAIESRGFGAPVERTSLAELTMTRLDYGFLAIFLAAFAVVTYIAFFGGGMRMAQAIRAAGQ
jgi:energy-coupling factor transport system permease protein